MLGCVSQNDMWKNADIYPSLIANYDIMFTSLCQNNLVCKLQIHNDKFLAYNIIETVNLYYKATLKC